MDHRDRYQGGRDQSRWTQDDDDQRFRSDRNEDAHFGQEGYRPQHSGGRDRDDDRRFGESGGYGRQYGAERQGSSFGGTGYGGQTDRGQFNYGGTGPAPQYGQTYGQGGSGAESYGQSQRDYDRSSQDQQGGRRGRGFGQHFGRSGQPGAGESDLAHGLSQSAGYGPQALGQGAHGRSAQQGFGPSGYGGFGQGGYAGGTSSMGQGQRTAGGYNQQYGRAYDEGAEGFGGSGQYSGAQRGGQGGSAPGFGEGGAFQQGWGGQSDHQRREMERPDHRDAGDDRQGGGTYGLHDRSDAARRSTYRTDQQYGAMHQDQGFTGFAGYGGGPATVHGDDHDHEPDYVHYRNSRLSELDREHHERRTAHARELDDHYREFRGEKRNRFHNEFEDWRTKRSSRSGAPDLNKPDNDRATVSTGSGTNIGGGVSATDRDEERTKNLSSPGGGQRTDMSGVGDHGSSTGTSDVLAGGGSTGSGMVSTPTTETGGGAGLRGAGASTGGSSATMGSGSGSAGADQTNAGASSAGVTTSSEEKKRH